MQKSMIQKEPVKKDFFLKKIFKYKANSAYCIKFKRAIRKEKEWLFDFDWK